MTKPKIDENHQREQYFWDKETVSKMADFVQGTSNNPCCLCCPMLGKELVNRGVSVTILDIDERFSDLKGFQKFDVYRPHWIDDTFDLIICDPPFWTVKLSQLFSAIKSLANHNYKQSLLVSYPVRRAVNLQGVFWRFDLQPTGYQPGYISVQKSEKNEIEFYGNVSIKSEVGSPSGSPAGKNYVKG